MFQRRRSDSKSEDRLRPTAQLAAAAAATDQQSAAAVSATTSGNHHHHHGTSNLSNISHNHNNERIRSLSSSSSKPQQQNQLQYQIPLATNQHQIGSCQHNIPMEDVKSHRIRGGGIYQSPAAAQSTNFMQSSTSSSSSSNNNNAANNPNQRNNPNQPQQHVPGSTNRTTTTTTSSGGVLQHDYQNMNHNPHQQSSNQHHLPMNQQQQQITSSRSMSNSESQIMASSSRQQQAASGLVLSKPRTASTSAIKSNFNQNNLRDNGEFRTTSLTTGGSGSSSSRSQQQDTTRIADDVATMIKEELENELDKLREEEEEIVHKQQQPQVGNDNQIEDNSSSFDRDLPVEVSFLIRQQAFCMARMNYFDRQIREIKESLISATSVGGSGSGNSASATPVANMQTQYNHLQQQQQQQQLNYYNHQAFSPPVPSNYLYSQQPQPIYHQQQQQQLQRTTMIGNHNVPIGQQHQTHGKNGNFILSDDSGGEYSRATISDDDELSSLLDQIAKSVRPERGSSMIHNQSSMINGSNQQQQQVPLSSHIPQQQQQQQQLNQQHQQQQRAGYQNLMAPPPHQQYAILNHPSAQFGHHHHQTVPVFVMGSPIAVAHPSSISSTVLPGVHFQPEPRYNQYYEDYYTLQNNANILATPSTSSLLHQQQLPYQQQQPPKHNGNFRSQQFDSSLSAIEQLVSRKEKRQIKSQLRSADNWLRMRAAGLCNGTTNLNHDNTTAATSSTDGVGGKTMQGNLKLQATSGDLTNDSGEATSGGVGSRGSGARIVDDIETAATTTTKTTAATSATGSSSTNCVGNSGSEN